jgi:hypothetical protein
MHEAYAHTLVGAPMLARSRRAPVGVGGKAGGPSLDQYVGRELRKRTWLPFGVLSVRARGGYAGDGVDTASWRGPNLPSSGESDPGRLFASVFGGHSDDNGRKVERLHAEGRSILDLVARDLQGYAARLGGEDRQKVLGHLEAVREVEARVALPHVTCGTMTAPARVDWRDIGQYERLIRTELDIVVEALACDAARVATVMLADSNSNDVYFPWLGKDYTGKSRVSELPGRNHHALSHSRSADGRALKLGAEVWYIKQLAHLLGRLDARREGAGSMLDNTAVLWADALADGADHTGREMPWIIAGRCGGALATGRVVRYPSAPHNGVLIALANAMGVATETFGDARYGGELPGLRVD